MASIPQTIKDKISSKKVVVYSKPTCPFCKMAKEVLKMYIKDGTLKEEDYEIIELSKLPNGPQVQAALGKMTGGSTVPRVFINGRCIGGGSETADLHKKNQLKSMLTN